MKSFAFFSLLVGFFFSCNNKEVPEPMLPKDYWGESNAEKNGEIWAAFPACWIDLADKKNITIELDSFYRGERQYYARESIVVAKIPPYPGTYRVKKLTLNVTNANSSLGFWDDDQPLGGYSILESDSSINLVSLQSYDTLSKEIRGTFNLSYLVQNRPYPTAPDTIRFKGGKFHGKIIEK